MTRAVRFLAVLLPAHLAWAQTLLPKPSALQHIAVTTTASADSTTPGGSLTLWADVTPRAGVHVYASDANGTTPAALTLTPHARVTAGKPRNAAAEIVRTVGELLPVAAYRKPFRIEQPVTVARSVKVGEALTITGLVNYQACDDRVCYPAGTVPVSWAIKIRSRRDPG